MVKGQEAQISQPSGQDSPSLGTALLLEKIYYGDSPGALRGPQALYEQARKQGLTQITKKDCIEYLKSQPTYTLYRPARKNYARNSVLAQFCGQVVQIDIMDMQKVQQADILYVLLAYDTYSKYLASYCLRNRKPDSIQAGLEHFVTTLPFTILNIYWDKEGSFLSRQVQAWLASQDIGNYTTKSKVKAPGVERVIRTIRTAVQRHFEATSSQQWLDYLPKFVNSYNNRKHSTTKLRPLDIVNDPTLIVQSKHVDPRQITLPPIGSFVRLNRLRGIFEKEATGNFTEEIFKVICHKKNQPIPMIVVEDLVGEPILGSLYPEEYQLIKWRKEKKVAQVVDTRRHRGVNKRLVTYIGWPPNYSEWIT